MLYSCPLRIGFERIKQELTEWIRDRQQKRLRWTQRDVCILRLRKFDEAIVAALKDYVAEPMPLPVDLAQYVEVQTLIGLPSTAQLPVRTYLTLLPALIERWFTDAEASLRTLVDPSWQPGASAPIFPLNRPASPDTLTLARAVFLCGGCRKTFHAFELYTHPCLHSQHPYWHTTPEDAFPNSDGRLPQIEGTLVDSARLAHFRGCQPWSATSLTFRGHIADAVIRLCEREPRTATIKQLDECNARLICRLCSIERRRVLVVNWRAAVSFHASARLR